MASSLPDCDGMDETDVEHFFDRVVIPRLRAVRVSRVASQLLDILTEGNRHQPLLDRGLSAVETWLSENVELIKAKFSEASKFTPAPLDAYIVNKFVEGIIALIHEVAANPEHELRRRFDVAVQNCPTTCGPQLLIAALVDCCCATAFGILKDGNLLHRVLLDRVRAHVLADLGSGRSAVRDMITASFVSVGKGVASEPSIQRKLNAR